MEVTESDRQWLDKDQPGLSLKKRGDVDYLEGDLVFDMAYIYDTSAYGYFDPFEKFIKMKNRIRDRYSIRVCNLNTGELPIVQEIGGRIEDTAERQDCDIMDLHVDKGNHTCCLCGYLDGLIFLRGNPSLVDCFKQLILPFFYDQSYHRLFGIWPRGGYEHESLGLLENYAKLDQKDLSILAPKTLYYLRQMADASVYIELLKKSGDVKGGIPCLCMKDSDTKFRLCHPKAFRGLWMLKRVLHQQRIEIE